MRKSITAGVNRRYQKIRKRGRLKYRLLTTSLRKLPEFLIIGTQKGGTTSLHAYLDQHPMLIMSSHKEPHFFTFAYDRGINYYKHYFPYRWQNQLSGEATPAYFCHPDVPARVHAMLPAAKLILLLRNPVERAFSAHQMNLRKGWETEADFEKVVDREFDWLNDSKNYRVNGDIHYDDFFHNHIYLAKGRYGSYLGQWLKYFGRQQI
ncbi:MAG: sulfotransferase domain-containing protein, partial [Cyanobacteria bacterium J06649_11]